MNPVEINQREANWIIEHPKACKNGLFWHYDEYSGKYIGIDNTTEEAWTEEFDAKQKCLNWLERKMSKLTCDRCGYNFRLDYSMENGIQKRIIDPEKEVSLLDRGCRPVVLCQTCMRELNSWLKEKKSMKCDRCGESFDGVLEQEEQANNAITKCSTTPDKKIASYDNEPIVLCPSCMEKLNDWLKGEQK